MSGCSTSVSTEVRDPNQDNAVVDCFNLSKASDQDALRHENEVDEENELEDGNRNTDVAEEEDEDEDADFNPFLKETNSMEASSSLSSEVEDLDLDVADSKGKQCAAVGNESGKHRDTSGDVENCDENVMHAVFSSGKEVGKNLDLIYSSTTEQDSTLVNQSGNGSLFDKESGLTRQVDVDSATDSRKFMVDVDAEGAICMRTRARYSLASFTLDELETFLQETDDEDDLQNVDDEEEYRKFLAAVLRGEDSQNLQENANVDDEDEENDADFELELEEALESEPEEVEERRTTRRNRSQKASIEHSKRLAGQLSRPLRPLLPFASIESLSTAEGRHLTPNFSSSHMPPVNNGYTYGFTPHQIGQLHCLIHEHIQLLIQVFSLSVLEPGKSHIASEVKELAVQMVQKRDQALAWRTVPYPSFCFFPPYIHPSVLDGNQNMLPSTDGNKIAQQNLPCGSNRELDSDEQAGSSQIPEYHSWVPYVCGPVLSVTDVAPLKLVENYIDDVSSAVRAYERHQIERGFETPGQKEPLFPLRNSLCSPESVGQGEMDENTPLDSNKAPSPSASHRLPKKNMATTLLERAKNQPVAPVPKEIARLAQRFWSLFNPALYPHKPAPASLTTRVLFTDAEDELLALGLMEYNTDWKAIQQRFLPCKSRHQIFVRQKNRASSKAPENPIKSVRRIKNAPLTLEEIARIELGLKKFKLDFMSIWRFFLPYRDPSLLPRQWRIATGTQKSYKSDANKKAKRRLYESKRKSSKPSPSSWHSSSEKEGDSSDNAAEETNSGDNHIDKEDEAYVHEAFLADWMPENHASSSFPSGLLSQEISQAKDKPGYRDIQPPMYSKSALASRPSTSEIVMRPYRARKPNNARLVKLAPGLPPVNLPPSVRIMSQSAFKNSQAITSAKDSANIMKNAGLMPKNRTLHAGSNMQVGVGSSVQSGVTRNNHVNVTIKNQQRNLSDVATNKLTVERGDTDLQMHPLLFQAPQDCQLPYYPSSPSTSSSFSFFPGNQPQLSLSLFHNPRHIRDAVNFLSKSSKPPEKNAAPSGVDFHPLLQRTDDVSASSLATHPAGRLPPTAASKPPIRNHLSSTSKASVDGNSSASGTKGSSLSKKGNELDLNIHLSLSAKNRESRNTIIRDTSRSLAASASGVIESESAKDYTPDVMSNQFDSTETPLATPRNRGSRKVADDMHDESLPEIVMEQEELSDSEEEFGENVEFECEEMADSDAECTSDSEQVVNVPNEEMHLEETDADIDERQLQNDHGSNPCSTSEACSIGLDTTGLHVKPNALSLNLNSCPPASQSNPKNAYEFGPFGTRAGDDKFLVDLKGSGKMQKRTSKHLSGDTPSRTPRKRVCRSNSNSNAATIVENSKKVAKVEFG
ncbi:uncharacterized protein LOC125201119 [Salvia hispanica]|uniref:uncharacterized protein LOC125201119 n=1 Tax=Salvia hispanica TaxID=49212 RepID=UPI00200910D6|nr:uncharacterized protein LOC125201119 [Salvia hispanica]XP_047955011.1 uncharacterized protein LOC125201119 [Salvia hispanica]